MRDQRLRLEISWLLKLSWQLLKQMLCGRLVLFVSSLLFKTWVVLCCFFFIEYNFDEFWKANKILIAFKCIYLLTSLFYIHCLTGWITGEAYFVNSPLSNSSFGWPRILSGWLCGWAGLSWSTWVWCCAKGWSCWEDIHCKVVQNLHSWKWTTVSSKWEGPS